MDRTQRLVARLFDGLPILEAMACGLAPIVPRGGASDDFVSGDTGLFLDSQEVETNHEWTLVGPALELSVDINELRRLMRSAYTNSSNTAEIGRRAAKHVKEKFTWQDSFELMIERIEHNARLARPDLQSAALSRVPPMQCRHVSACVRTFNNEKTIAECLSSVAPFIDETIVLDSGSSDRTVIIAREYGARVIVAENGKGFRDEEICALVKTDWYFWLEPNSILNDRSSKQIASLIKAQPRSASEVAMQIEVTRIDQSETPRPMAIKFIRAPRSQTKGN